MMTMTEARRASEALREAAEDGHLTGTLTPAVFGCPHGHTLGIITSPLPFGRCRRCEAPLAVLDAEQIEQAVHRAA